MNKLLWYNTSMKQIWQQHRIWVLLGAGILLLAAAGGWMLWGPRTVIFAINGEEYSFRSSARRVAALVTEAGLTLAPEDSVEPPLTDRLRRGETITIDQAVWVQFYEEGTLQSEFRSASRQPLDLLVAGQVLMKDEDELRWQDVVVTLEEELPLAPYYIFEIRRAAAISIEVDGQTIQLVTTEPTVADALAEAGVTVSGEDELSAPLDGKPVDYPVIVLRRARQVTITADGQTVNAWTTADTVGGTLADAGLALTGLDRSLPMAETDLPADGRIDVVRVREEVLLAQTYLPYGRDLQPDPELPLDQRNIITPGRTGIEVTRTRVTYENGTETTRMAEAAWTASAPQDEILGYGQQINISAVDTEYGSLDYYRSVTMYATSYHPCAFSDGCHYTTRGGCTLEKGVVAVSGAWYPYMVGQQVYIPGYGRAVVCDSGGGIPGRYWIDLGFSDDDYVGWYHWVTVYFLTPVPETILWILP